MNNIKKIQFTSDTIVTKENVHPHIPERHRECYEFVGVKNNQQLDNLCEKIKDEVYKFI